jgi:hypothetical protein
MGRRCDKQCLRCKKWEVETVNEWISPYCCQCNDIKASQLREPVKPFAETFSAETIIMETFFPDKG